MSKVLVIPDIHLKPFIFDIADNLGEKATKNITDVIKNSQIFYTRIEWKDNVERQLKIIK